MSQMFLFDIESTNTGTASFYEAMQFFNNVPKTEEAFYLRFQIMPVEYKTAIYKITGKKDDWQIFKEICKFYRI